MRKLVMVISEVIKCSSCGEAYRARIGVGIDGYQQHYIDCIKCFLPIVLAVRADPPNATIEATSNCEIIPRIPDDQLTIINFHPACAFNKEDLHDPRKFASMDMLSILHKHVRVHENQRMISLSHDFDVPNAPTKWSQLKTALQMLLNDKKDNAERIAKIYMKKRNEDGRYYIPGRNYSHLSLLYEYLAKLHYPLAPAIAGPITDKLNVLKAEGKLDDFYKFYRQEIKTENLQRYINILSSYMANRDHFGQLMYYARVSHDDIDDLIVSSKNFDSIKNFYGDAYETLTSNVTVLACINNITDGRSYDEFISMTLNKYIKDVSKENKTNPFKTNPLMSAFCESDLESTIRNGSHHASIWHDGEVIKYRSGGTGAQRDISYTRFLYLCNKLTIKIVALWFIEIHLQYLFESESGELQLFTL